MPRMSRRDAALSLAAVVGLAPVRALAEESQDEPATQVATTTDAHTHMLAPVTLNGQGPYSFVLDTGANVSCVSTKLAADLQLEAGPPKLVHTVAGARERPSVLIDQLQVGKRSRRRVSAPALPLKDPGLHGVLGVDWLKGQRLVLDFKSRNIEITRSQEDESRPGRVVVVAARKKMGQLTIVDADLNGEPISAIIDSGAQATMCNGPLKALAQAQERRAGRVSIPTPVMLESLAGEPVKGEAIYLPFLRLGGLHLGNVQVTYADMHVFKLWDLEKKPALVLGMDLLTQFEQVALDFGRSAVRFQIS